MLKSIINFCKIPNNLMLFPMTTGWFLMTMPCHTSTMLLSFGTGMFYMIIGRSVKYDLKN